MGNLEQVVDALCTGHARKKFAATAMNERSSRSHTAFIVQVLQTITKDGPESSSGDKVIKSQLHLVDLAGSERVKKSKVSGQRLREAIGINRSLLVLGKVIAALVESKSHVPYFESKLTTLLKSAFGGNCRTTAVVNCRIDDEHGDETLQSMRFGERCGMISNSMRVAASDLSTAMRTINAALELVKSQLAGLEARGKQHLASYKNLEHMYAELTRKRDGLVALNGDEALALLG